MTLLKARPTTYNGVQMRSRLEARVAAWFDSMGIRWEYEPRAFATQAGQYLPDFALYSRYMSEPWAYLEVRGVVDSSQALDRVHRQMEIIHASEPRAILLWADANALEEGELEAYGWRSGRVGWVDILWSEILTTALGVPRCEHYRLPT